MILISLLEKLVSFPSVTPLSAGSIDFIKKFLKKSNFLIKEKTFSSKVNKVENIYAKFGKGEKNICFLGHLDVVPVGNVSDWKYSPFSLTKKNGFLYGRGVVDMKGPICAFLSAFDQIKHEIKNISVSILLTTDEEGPAENGVKKMFPWILSQKEKIDFVIAGEPTYRENLYDNIAIGRRGSANFLLKIYGKQGHVAYDSSFKNPIYQSIKVIQSLKKRKIDLGNKYFPPSSLQVTSFDCKNDVTNLIPQSAEIRFNVRFNNNFTEEKIKTFIENIIKEQNVDYDLSCEIPSLPFLAKKSEYLNILLKSVEKITNNTPNLTTDGATSDLRFIFQHCPCAEFGLDYTKAHQVDESVNEKDLLNLSLIYKTFLQMCERQTL